MGISQNKSPKIFHEPLGEWKMGLVCWSLTSLCHSNGHIETMPAREINPFTALTRIRSQFLRTQWSTSNHQRVNTTALQTTQPSGLASERWETSAEITHLVRETVPYAFYRTFSDVLCIFKRFHNFIFSPECEMAIARTWCQSGEFVLECKKVETQATLVHIN